MYLVTWDIELSADSPRKAAEMALEIQRDPYSLAEVFTVDAMDGSNPVFIDLVELRRQEE